MRVLVDLRMARHTGIGRYVRNLALALTRDAGGHEVLFLVPADGDLFGRPSRSSLPDQNAYLPDLRDRCVTAHSGIFTLGEQWELPRLAARVRPDLLHSPQFNVPLAARVAQLTTIHDVAFRRFPEEIPSVWAGFYYRIVFPSALRKSRRIIAVSESTRADLVRFFGVRPEKVDVIYHGVGEEFFQPPSARTRAYAHLAGRFGFAEPFCLYVGLARPRKNLLTLLRAFKMLVEQQGRDLRLVLAGPHDDRFVRLSDAVQEMGLADRVTLTGAVNDDVLLDLYAAAALFVLPSLYEGFGLTVLEAMASGTPVVASRASSIPEVAGDAALMFDPQDPQDLATAIATVLDDASLRERLVARGQEWARRFTWERCARETLRSYERAV